MVLGLSPRQPLPEPRAEFSFAVDVPTARSSASAAANLRLGEPMARVTCSDANRQLPGRNGLTKSQICTRVHCRAGSRISVTLDLFHCYSPLPMYM